MNKKGHQDYFLWACMRKRCDNPNAKDYKHYGGRGITYDPRWDDFWAFIEDMGARPNRRFTLDRIDNSKSYTKGNCRWATRQDQTDNRRISYECYKGHPWTQSSTIKTHNGRGETRRCKICYEKRISP